ncbi:MAG: recombinase RecA [Deltaproteobacteria bacterium]|nr:recombinase RecA [Deltaproteobacteria bacterium]
MSRKSEKMKELEGVIAALDKQFGKGTVMRIGGGAIEQVPVFPTGSMSLDAALGVGGVPRGRIVEVFGPESSGKTTLSLEMIAQAQRQGAVAAFIDAEHALDLGYAKRLGVAVEDLLVSQPDCGEQALDITEALVRSGVVDLVVVDSVAALTPRAEIEGDMGDTHVGLQARLMSQALRKLVAACHKQACTVLFINQLRTKIGVMFGNPETTTGGNALKFYCSIRLEVRKIGTQKDGTSVTGTRVRVKVVKNKVAPPFTEAEFDVVFGEGINKTMEVLEMGERLGVVEKAGTWMSFGGEQLGQGREQADRRLRGDPALLESLSEAVRTASLARRAGAGGGAGAGAGGNGAPDLADAA